MVPSLCQCQFRKGYIFGGLSRQFFFGLSRIHCAKQFFPPSPAPAAQRLTSYLYAGWNPPTLPPAKLSVASPRPPQGYGMTLADGRRHERAQGFAHYRAMPQEAFDRMQRFVAAGNKRKGGRAGDEPPPQAKL